MGGAVKPLTGGKASTASATPEPVKAPEPVTPANTPAPAGREANTSGGNSSDVLGGADQYSVRKKLLGA